MMPLNNILNPISRAKIDGPMLRTGEPIQPISRLFQPVGIENDTNDKTGNSNTNNNTHKASGTQKLAVSKPILSNWETSVENRLEGFGSRLNTILSLLQNQQNQNNDLGDNKRHSEVDVDQKAKRQKLGETLRIADSELPSSSSSSSPKIGGAEMIVNTSEYNNNNSDSDDPVVRLNSILSREDAQELFNFFNNKISPQLFGFDISKYSIDGIWETCPLLIATIGCIASVHHPVLGDLGSGLEKIIYDISKDILFKMPKTEIEAFNTIIALCFCGFWFENNQMFTGLAIQIAKTMNLLSSRHKKKSVISRKDRLKLWYLLYILDGQQSLVFNRQCIIDSRELTLKNSKELLLEAENEDRKEMSDKKEENQIKNIESFKASYSDIRLISQVEYHHAINAVFEGQAWDLLTPSSFGLPFKSNLELDKWMVQWTVLLSPFKNHPIWSSKSTLIYYNFAKMHINSAAVRKFQSDGIDLPKFDEIDDDFNNMNNSEKDYSGEESSKIEIINKIESIDSDDEDDDTDLFDIAKELSPLESKKVSAELALSSAETVLNIVLGDPDILSVLKYVPIHIHIMLYYSALIILKSQSEGCDGDDDGKNAAQFESALDALHLVKRLRASIAVNSPTDREFSKKFMQALTSLIDAKARQLKRHNINNNEKLKQIAAVEQLDHGVGYYDASVYKGSNERGQDEKAHKRKQKISAWPGYDAGHPSKKKEYSLS